MPARTDAARWTRPLDRAEAAQRDLALDLRGDLLQRVGAEVAAQKAKLGMPMWALTQPFSTMQAPRANTRRRAGTG